MADLGPGLFTPPVDAREKEKERQREAAAAAAEAAAAPEVDPRDRPAPVLSDLPPPAPINMVRVVWQSAITAVILAGLGIASWFFIVSPLLDRQTEEIRARGEAIQASMRRVTDQMRLEQARLQRGNESLNARSLELSNQVTALEDRVLDLNREVNTKQVERDRLENEITTFLDDTQSVRDRNESLLAENDVLQESVNQLISQEQELSVNIADLTRENIQAESKNRIVTAENQRLIEEMDEQRAAMEELSGRLLTVAEDVDAQRQQLITTAENIEGSRQEFVAGLEDLADEYARIAARNYGPVKLRYLAFSRDVKAQVGEVNDQSIDLSFGEASAEDIRQQVEAYLTSSLVLGKSVEVRFVEAGRATAEEIRDVLGGAGLAVTMVQVDEGDVGDRADEISYSAEEDEVGAEQIQLLVQDGAGAAVDLVREEDRLPVNYVLWITSESETSPEDSFEEEPSIPEGEEQPAPPAQPVAPVNQEGEEIPEIPSAEDEAPPSRAPEGEEEDIPEIPTADDDAPPSRAPEGEGEEIPTLPGEGDDVKLEDESTFETTFETEPEEELPPEEEPVPPEGKPEGDF